MYLSGSQYEKLHQAIKSAYPAHTKLKRMVRIQLEANLDAIAGEGKLDDVVTHLIDWAEAEGKTESLIIGAYSANQGNPKLKEFYQTTFEQRFIVNPTSVKSSTDMGPAIEWQGPGDELQLEGWLKSEPDFWDVNF